MKKKWIIIVTVFLVLVLAVGAVAVKTYKEKEKKDYGILLAFDDYSVASWEDNFELFDEYDVHVTFFVNANGPTDFCKEAEKRGHEIGFHTMGHVNLTEVSKEEFYKEAIEPVESFREAGIAMTSFAYPYGAYEDWMNEELLKYYDSVRGAFYYRGYFKQSVNKGFIESMSIDNIHFESDEQFREEMRGRLEDLVACEEGTVVSLYSHAIEGGDWCVTPDRLRILFEEADKLGIQFYTFQELQK